MNDSEQQYNAKVAALAVEYERNGYTVQRQPRAPLPFDLGSYRPDLLAEKGDEHLVIEVKSSQAPISLSYFRDLVETIRQQPGWRFLLVIDSPTQDAASLLREPLSWQGITDRLAHAEHLQELGESEAATLIFWTALEGLLRRYAESIGLPLGHLPVTALLNYLYSEAELSFEQFDKAKKLMASRNQLAHGFQTQGAAQYASELQELIKELADNWWPTQRAA